MSADETAEHAAIKALVPLALYDYGQVPGLLNPATKVNNPGQTPTSYGLLSIERRYVDRATDRVGRNATEGWRISIRVCAKSAHQTRFAAKGVNDALEGVRLPGSTPIRHESSTSVEPDDGYYTALHEWTYAT